MYPAFAPEAEPTVNQRTLPDAPRIDLTRLGFTASDLATPTGRMRVFRAGGGPPLVLLPGIGGGARDYYWRRLGPLLAERFTVWAPDFVGWGESHHPARFLLFDDYVAQIQALLDHTGPVRAVAAQGVAAGFSIAAALARPADSVDGLVLMAPTGGRDFGKDAFDPVFALTLSMLARWPGVNLAIYRRYFHRRSAYSFWFERRGFLDPAKVPDDLIDAGFQSGAQPDAAYSALPFVAGSLRYDLAPWLEKVDRPSLMLWGSDEAQIKPAIRRRLEAVNPGRIAVRSISATRTNFEVEAPDLTARALLSFLGGAA